MPDAPRVFISYSHDSEEHRERVLELSDRLRDDGVDCRIDHHEQSPAEGWPQWCDRQIGKSNFVLVACTKIYLRRFNGEEELGCGLGGTWEGHIITQELYNAQGKNTKFIPILFSPRDATSIPLILQSGTHYDVSLPEGYENLYRHITGQPLHPIPPLGSLKPMLPRQALPPLPKFERKQSSLPQWNVPYARNLFFTGREKILDDLHKTLEAKGIAALCGLPGVGKTQTAVEYAWRHRKQHGYVLWAKAESRDTLVSDFASIATLLRLPESTAKEQEAAVSAVKRWLEYNSGWMLVLDNADDLALVREFIPLDFKGHILLSTRAQSTSPVAQRVEIEKMEPPEGALFLLRRAGVISNDALLTATTEADRNLAEQVSVELGGLPLALDQAGAFIEETPSSLAEYIDLYKSEGAKLRAERGNLGDHPSVTVTFSLAFGSVAANSAAADLIRVCAFLSPDAIPEEIFTDGARELGESLGNAATSKVDFAKVLKETGRFSLIDRNPEKKTLDIHRLVQAVVKDGMDPAEQRRWAERAVRATNCTFPEQKFQNWPTCERLLPHAQACAALAAEFGFELPEVAHLLNAAGFYLGQRARFAETEPLFQRALAIREKVSGAEHPDVASSLHNLATLFREQGKYADAELLSHRALAIREKRLGAEHPDMASSLNNLASLYRDQGRYAEAEPLFHRALALREKVLGAEHDQVAMSLNNLASLYVDQGKYAEAEPLFHRALAIQEKALGLEHPDVATSLNNLAALLVSNRRYAEAEPLLRRSLQKWENALGGEHPNIGASLNNLAAIYRDQGRYAEAEPLFHRALAIREKVLGAEHPDVASSISNLAGLYRRQGRYADAEPLFRRALAIQEKVLGKDHPDVAATLSGYAVLLRKVHRQYDAAKLEKRAKAILAKHRSQNIT